MLFTLVMIQALLSLILNQTYQSLMAQLESSTPAFPVYPAHEIEACLRGRCSEQAERFSRQLLTSNTERQFINAQLTLCENGHCWEINQVMSEPSAILKEERIYHAIKVQRLS